MPWVIALAIAAGAAGGTMQSGGQGAAGIKKPPPEKIKFVRGPSVKPSFVLKAWFENQMFVRDARQVRVPLVLQRGTVGFSLRGARIGAALDALEVYANDSALGIGLDDRARTHCKASATCAFWAEGRMGREVDGSLRFDVLRVASPIEPPALAAADFVEIEVAEESVDGFPLPVGARKIESAGGATSLAPGRNFKLQAFDVEMKPEAVAAFYAERLPGAKRSSAGGEVTFSTLRGRVTLAPIPSGTRLTLAIGPQ
jgi:hypothetical protein